MTTGKTNLTSTQFASKKLLGKAHTNNQFSDVNESIPSNISVPSKTIFADPIPNSPGTDSWSITDSVEKVHLEVVSLSNTIYDANDTNPDGGGDEPSAQGAHGYYLKLPSDYTTQSSNSKKGTGDFTNSARLYNSRGRLQLVPPLISNANPNYYFLKLYSGAISDINEITSGDSIDWQIDYYSGVIFIQDFNNSKVPVSASAYLYVGDYLDDKLSSVTSSVGDAVQYGRTVVTTDLTSSTDDRILAVNATASLQITLPSANGFSNGQYFTIKDEAGNADVNNITVVAGGSDTIDGTAQVVLESPYAAINLYSNGTNKFFIY